MVVDGLITCERVVLGKGAKLLISCGAQGIYLIVEDEVDDQEERQDDRREDGQ